jgi:cell division protein ZapA
MDELAIKIRIEDRDYPMKVDAEDEACVRKAGKLINSQIKNYKEQFGINDKQDLLAMVAFDCLVENLKLKNKAVEEEEQLTEKLNQLIRLVQVDLSH